MVGPIANFPLLSETWTAMSTTRKIAVTGASEHDVARIAALLDRHRHKLSTAWESTQAGDADLLLVDVESMYGQMDWLRARSRGQLVIAYTSASEPIEPEFSLRKPVVSGELVALLNRISAGLSEGKAKAAEAMQPANAATYETMAPERDANPVAAMPVPTATIMPRTSDPQAIQAPVSVASTKAATPDTYLIDELLAVLTASDGPVRLVHEGLPSIIIDPVRQRWYAGVGLKPLIGWTKLPLRRDELVHLDADEFERATEILPALPYSRLVWFAHFARSQGSLDAGLPGGARYRLTRWPQVEREFPKHFRIATSMMRGVGTVEEIAAQSTASAADVVDFVNAYHALGYVECEATLPVTAPNDRSGLLQRVRNSLRN